MSPEKPQQRSRHYEPVEEEGGEGRARHELKCWPPYFEHVLTGQKTFEVRSIEDRRFEVGDTLLLREYDGSLKHRAPETEGYTGRTCTRTVTYILGDGDWGIDNGTVVLALAHPQHSTEGAGVEPPYHASRRIREEAERSLGGRFAPEHAQAIDNVIGRAIAEYRYGSPEEQAKCPECGAPRCGQNDDCDCCIEFRYDAAAEMAAEESPATPEPKETPNE